MALLHGAEGRRASGSILSLSIVLVVAVVMLMLADTGGFRNAVTARWSGRCCGPGRGRQSRASAGVAVMVDGCGGAFPTAATMLFPICFALFAATAAFTLDERPAWSSTRGRPGRPAPGSAP